MINKERRLTTPAAVYTCLRNCRSGSGGYWILEFECMFSTQKYVVSWFIILKFNPTVILSISSSYQLSKPWDWRITFSGDPASSVWTHVMFGLKTYLMGQQSVHRGEVMEEEAFGGGYLAWRGGQRSRDKYNVFTEVIVSWNMIIML